MREKEREAWRNRERQRQKDKNSLHNSQRRTQVGGHQGRHGGQADEPELQRRVVLADSGGVHLGRGQRKVPVAGEGLGRRQRDPAVVDGRDGEADVPPEDDDGEPDCKDSRVSNG